MASIDRSAAVQDLGGCLACASGATRLPQSNPQAGPAPGQIRKLQASVFAPLVEFLELELDVGRGRPGRPGIISPLSDMAQYEVHLLATLSNREGVPSYDKMPNLLKFFILQVAQALGDSQPSTAAAAALLDLFHIHTCSEWVSDKDQYVMALPLYVPRKPTPWSGILKQGSDHTRVVVDAAPGSDLDRLMSLKANLMRAWLNATENEPEVVDAMIEEFEAFVESYRSRRGSATPSVVSPESNEGASLPQTPSSQNAGNIDRILFSSTADAGLAHKAPADPDLERLDRLESSLFSPITIPPPDSITLTMESPGVSGDVTPGLRTPAITAYVSGKDNATASTGLTPGGYRSVQSGETIQELEPLGDPLLGLHS
ncbi:unnamed protein product [Peniophora sp. CBMAI 1063]|nr:unnamed protein product [Peniophora sp. CBMAI 1063]